MLTVLPFLLALAALQAETPSEAAEPHFYMCELNRAAGGGMLTVSQSLPTAATPSARKTWWKPGDWQRGGFFAITWEGDRPGDALTSGDVHTFFFVWERRHRVRILVRSIGADGTARDALAGPFSVPDQAPTVHIAWPLFRRAAAGAAALEIAAVREDGRVVASRRVQAADITGLEAAVIGAQPAFDAMLADRNRRCAYYRISSVMMALVRAAEPEEPPAP